MGKLFDEKPHGREIPQLPERLTEVVNISSRYIFSGSSTFSPFKYAVVGDTGVYKISQDLKTFSKSFFIKDLTFCARL